MWGWSPSGRRTRRPWRPRKPNTLARFVDDYIKRRTIEKEGRSDVKSGTAIFYGHTRRCLVEFFGATQSLGKINPSEAEEPAPFWLI